MHPVPRFPRDVGLFPAIGMISHVVSLQQLLRKQLTTTNAVNLEGAPQFSAMLIPTDTRGDFLDLIITSYVEKSTMQYYHH